MFECRLNLTNFYSYIISVIASVFDWLIDFKYLFVCEREVETGSEHKQREWQAQGEAGSLLS